MTHSMCIHANQLQMANSNLLVYHLLLAKMMCLIAVCIPTFSNQWKLPKWADLMSCESPFYVLVDSFDIHFVHASLRIFFLFKIKWDWNVSHWKWNLCARFYWWRPKYGQYLQTYCIFYRVIHTNDTINSSQVFCKLIVSSVVVMTSSQLIVAGECHRQKVLCIDFRAFMIVLCCCVVVVLFKFMTRERKSLVNNWFIIIGMR